MAVAGIAIAKGKKPTKLLSDIDLNKGIATLKNDGSSFTGKIVDTLKNGDKVVLEYKDGILKSSERTGKKNIRKIFDKIDGNKIVNIETNGTKVTANITEKIKNGKDIAKEIADKKADTAQFAYNAPFEAKLTNKSAKESANAFEEHSQKLIKEKLQAEEIATKKANTAQAEYKAQFETKLSNKSAEESANVFKENDISKIAKEKNLAEEIASKKADAAQITYNAPFEEKLSNKSAKKSTTAFVDDMIGDGKKAYDIQINEDGTITRKIRNGKQTTVETQLYDENLNIIARESDTEISKGTIANINGKTWTYDNKTYQNYYHKDDLKFVTDDKIYLATGKNAGYLVDDNNKVVQEVESLKKLKKEYKGEDWEGTIRRSANSYYSKNGFKLTTQETQLPYQRGTSHTTKLFKKDKNGKFKCINRTQADNVRTKTVEQLKNGNSKTTINNFQDNYREVILRDKKGKILSREVEKLQFFKDFKPFNPAENGFSPISHSHRFADGSTAFIHEGPGLLDVTSDGKLLVKKYADWYLKMQNLSNNPTSTETIKHIITE